MRRLDEIHLGDKDRAAIQAAADALRERFAVAEGILFGSKARGDDRPDSDIDLLVLAERAVAQRRRPVYDVLDDVMLAHDVVIQALVEPDDDWLCFHGQPLPLREVVEREGVTV